MTNLSCKVMLTKPGGLTCGHCRFHGRFPELGNGSEGHGHSRESIELGLNPDGSVMRVDDPFRDGQSEATAVHAVLLGCVTADETLEYAADLRLWNPRTGVANRQPGRGAVGLQA